MAEPAHELWERRYEDWLHYLNEVIRVVESGRKIPLGPSREAPEPPVPPKVTAAAAPPPKIVYCAPHPDDESLSGALALRLRLESAAKVTVAAITLGRKRPERQRRLRELESACRSLEFRLVVPNSPEGLENVNLESRKARPEEWAASVRVLREIFDREEPDAVFTPHAEDFNTTHIGTHHLALEALGEHLERKARGPMLLIETEFWRPMAAPNLMLGVAPELAARQLIAATEHGGEMTRNPYHLLHPCRLMDNVRRGSEVVGGQGAAAQPFPFAELYRVSFMKGRQVIEPSPGGRIAGPEEKIDLAWLNTQFAPEG